MNGHFYAQIFVGTNSYITFGAGSAVYSSLSANRPNFPTLFIGAADNSASLIAGKPVSENGVEGYVVRFEGSRLLSTSIGQPPDIIWEATFFNDDTVRVAVGLHGVIQLENGGLSSLSDGNGQSAYKHTGDYVKHDVSDTIITGIIPEWGSSGDSCEGEPNECLAQIDLDPQQTETVFETVCEPCAFGTFSSVTAQCRNCPEGSTSELQSRSTRCICVAGYAGQPGDGEACQACSNGTFTSDQGFETCTPCPPGTFTPKDGSLNILCVDCDGGKYSSTSGCSDCPVHTVSEPRSSSIADCECLPGYEGQSCSACEIGEYKAKRGNMSCTLCPAGEYAPSTGSSTCLKCGNNQFSNPARDTCETCSEGTVPVVTSSESGVDSCACKEGYTPEPGSSQTCAACARGKYKDKVGPEECSDCPEGTTTDANTGLGADSEEKCTVLDFLLQRNAAGSGCQNPDSQTESGSNCACRLEDGLAGSIDFENEPVQGTCSWWIAPKNASFILLYLKTFKLGAAPGARRSSANNAEELTVHTCNDYFCATNTSIAAKLPSMGGTSQESKFFVAAIANSGGLVKVSLNLGEVRKQGVLMWTSFTDPNLDLGNTDSEFRVLDPGPGKGWNSWKNYLTVTPGQTNFVMFVLLPGEFKTGENVTNCGVTLPQAPVSCAFASIGTPEPVQLQCADSQKGEQNLITIRSSSNNQNVLIQGIAFNGLYHTPADEVTVRGAEVGSGITLTISRSSFADCESENGGALHAVSSSIALSHVKFTSNKATQSGGAIFITGDLGMGPATLDVSNVEFRNNEAGGCGGDIDGSSSATIKLSDGVVLRGGRALHGGSICLEIGSKLSGQGHVIIADAVAVNGGGVYANGRSIVDLVDFSITGCKADSDSADGDSTEEVGRGGGVYLTGRSNLMAQNVFLVNNSGIRGGGIFAHDASTVQLNDAVEVRDCTATTGGGIAVEGDQDGGTSMTKLIARGNPSIRFLNNQAHVPAASGGDNDFLQVNDNPDSEHGGGIFASGKATVELDTVNISSCGARSGGAVFATGGATKVTFKHVAVMGCTSELNGGGVALDNNARFFASENVKFERNKAMSGKGGCIYARTGAEVDITKRVDFVDCSALKDGGGGIALENGATLSASDVHFTDCYAVRGGGLFAEKTEISLLDGSTFSGCKTIAAAPFIPEGGAIYLMDDCNLIGDNISFVNNLAQGGHGGGLFVLHSSVSLLGEALVSGGEGSKGAGVYLSNYSKLTADGNVRFAQNKASVHGGGVYATTFSEVHLRNGVQISGCTAHRGAGVFIEEDSTLDARCAVSFNENRANTILKNSENSDSFGGGAIFATKRCHVELSDRDIEDFSCESVQIRENSAGEPDDGSWPDVAESERDEQGSGGGVYLETDCEFHARGTSFFGNIAYNGAGVFAKSKCNVTLEESVVLTHGIAELGGGAHLVDGSTLIGRNYVVFVNNSKSAVFARRKCTVKLSGSVQVKLCEADRGGGVYLADSSLSANQEVTFEQNKAGDGGCIFATDSSTVKLSQSKLSGCIANSVGRMGIVTGSGGGVYLQDKSSLLASYTVEMSENHAKEDGGCVFAESSSIVELKNVVSLKSCSADKGGGVSLRGSRLLANNSVILENGTASAQGGCVSADQSSWVSLWDNVELKGCATLGSGGGLYLNDGSTLSAERDITFINNQADRYGGGIYARGTCTVQLSHTVKLNGCRAKRGGAVYLEESSALVAKEGVAFECNSDQYQLQVERGAGICAQAESKVILQNDVILENCHAERGGGILLESSVLLAEGHQEVVRFKDCSAKIMGGAILSWFNSNLTVSSLLFENTQAGSGSGGAIMFAESAQSFNHSVRDSEFIMCRSQANGGAIGSDGPGLHLQILNSRFIDCASSAFGGSMFAAKDTFLEIDECTFENSSSVLGGGALTSIGLPLVSRSTFSQCSSDGPGGAILTGPAADCISSESDLDAQHDTMLVSDCHFEGCSSKTSGGAIEHYGERLSILSSTFLYNSAVERGGAARVVGASLDLSFSTFTENNVSGSDSTGGAISCEGGSANLTH
eukprot:3093545-Rhodomonas_salina.1